MAPGICPTTVPLRTPKFNATEGPRTPFNSPQTTNRYAVPLLKLAAFAGQEGRPFKSTLQLAAPELFTTGGVRVSGVDFDGSTLRSRVWMICGTCPPCRLESKLMPTCNEVGTQPVLSHGEGSKRRAPT